MKNILVPTDFSENAYSALRAALNIAEQFGSIIHLLHVYQVKSNAATLINMQRMIRDERIQELDRTVEKVKNSSVTIFTKAIQGNAISVVCNYAEQSNIDLIVMGTKGATGLKEIFWGSNTAGIVKETHIPVLTIPKDYVVRPFKEIVLAIDSNNISTSKVIEPLVQLAEAYQSKVKVLHLERKKEMAGIDPSVDIYLSDIDHSFHQATTEGNISDAINTFTQDDHADLLCMIRREHNFLEEFYRPSTTRQSVLHSEIATLILHE